MFLYIGLDWALLQYISKSDNIKGLPTYTEWKFNSLDYENI